MRARDTTPAWRRLVAPLALVALVLLFFNRMAFSNLILARGDTFLYFYPYWQAAADALRVGRLPLWNPDIFMGAPLLANSQVGFFYPLNWPVWLLLPTPYAVSASILVHLCIACWGAYLAARRTMPLGRAAAFLAAALFALGGYLTAQVEHINQLQGLAWLPWFFVVLSPLVAPDAADRRWRRALPVVGGVGLLFALQLLAGHTQTTFISGAAVALWLAVHALTAPGGLQRQRLRKLARVAVVAATGVFLALLLAAVQLAPTLELTAQSSRQGGLPLNEVLSFSWHPLHLTRALLPGYGQALFSEYVAFLPLTAFALAVLGAWVWRVEPAVRPWLVLAAAGVVLALGQFTPVYYLLGRLPGFDLFRAPARWLAVAALGGAMLAGYGWQRLQDWTTAAEPESPQREVARRELMWPLLFAAAALAALVVWGYAAGWLASFVPVGAEAPFEPPATRTLLGWLIEFALAALLLWTILTVRPGRAHRATYDLLLLMLAVLWLGSRGLPYNNLTTPEAYFDLRPPQARLAAFAACAMPDNPCSHPADRFLSLSAIFFDPGDLDEIESIYADQLDAAAIYDYVVAVKQKEVLSPNLSMVNGLPAIDGFDGGILPPRNYTTLMQLILPEGSTTTDGRLREYLTAAPDARWLSLFNGRYLITDKTGDLWREGVFFDQEHPLAPGAAAVPLAEVTPFEATELWMLAGANPPAVEITTAAGETWSLASQAGEDGLYRLPFPRPATAERIAVGPCAEVDGCVVNALTLVDGRDETFQPLALPPYRLIFSGDVKIYENLDALPRAFMLYDWQAAAGLPATIAAMSQPGFDPGRTAVLTGEGPFPAAPAGGNGEVEVVDYRPESVRLRAASDAPGLLVLADAHYPGWQAAVDGSPAPIVQVDGMFRGVFLEAGQHEVVFTFRPGSVRVGAIGSAVGLVLLAGLALLATRRVGSRSVGQ